MLVNAWILWGMWTCAA
jgi:hypothetical protein